MYTPTALSAWHVKTQGDISTQMVWPTEPQVTGPGGFYWHLTIGELLQSVSDCVLSGCPSVCTPSCPYNQSGSKSTIPIRFKIYNINQAQNLQYQVQNLQYQSGSKSTIPIRFKIYNINQVQNLQNQEYQSGLSIKFDEEILCLFGFNVAFNTLYRSYHDG